MNQVSWNVGGTNGVGGVPGATDYSYVPDSDLLAGMSTARTDGAYTPVTAAYTYEDKRDVKTQVLNKAGARIISQYDYRYNSVGNRTSVVNSGEAFGSQHDASSPENREGFNLYSYNSRSEVTESKRYSGTDVDNPVDVVKPEYRSYAYDPIGNRTQAVEGCDSQESGKTSTYTANGLNQYETAATSNDASCSASNATSGLADGSTTFTYDADGNMTSISDATGYTVYSFDCENRLVDVTIQIQASPVRKVTFAYDFMGRRIKKDVYSWSNSAWSPASSRTFTWDGWLMTDETVTTGSSQPKTTSYVWGLDLSQTLTGAGGIGGVIATFQNGQANYFFYDVNGNVEQLIDSSNDSIAAMYQYDSYGSLISADGTKSESNSIRWSTKYFDTEICLYYYGSRYYSFDYGKWLNRDIIQEQGGINLYEFVSNSAINYYDNIGMCAVFRYNNHGTAEVYCDCNENVNDIAKEIGLTAADYKKWLKNADDYDEMPSSEYDKFNRARIFSIPNTVIAYWGGNDIDNVEIGNQRKRLADPNFHRDTFGKSWVYWRDNVSYLKELGFSVMEYNQDDIPKKNLLLQSELERRANEGVLHGLYYWGHGYFPEMPWYAFVIFDGFYQKTAVGLVSSNDSYDIEYGTINLPYKMALGLVFACDSNNGKSHLFSNAAGSIWHGHTGILWPVDRRSFPIKQYIKPGQQGTL